MRGLPYTCNTDIIRKDMEAFMIDQWIREIRQQCPAEGLGMILVHNGIVRATGKDGKLVRAMRLSYDREKLDDAVSLCKRKDGIAAIRVWVNEGFLQVGDDIMNVCVAGRFRTDVLPVFQELLAVIKRDIVREEEVFPGSDGIKPA